MFTSIRSLGRRIQSLVEQDKPEGFFSFTFTLSLLDLEDMDLLERMESLYGETRCNRWMVRLLNGTTVFNAAGAEHVVGVAPEPA